MKTARLLLVLLALFGVTTLSNAQGVSKSGREKGLIIRPEIGVGMGSLGKSDHYYALYLQGSVDYQFNPYFNAGVGAGFSTNNWCLGGIGKDKVMALPVYANLRAYLCDKKVSPFFDLKMGYNIPLNEGRIREEYNPPLHLWNDSYFKIKGLYGMLSFGLQAGGMDVGISMGWVQGVSREMDQNMNYNVKEHSNSYFMTAFSIAYNFQLK
ncbi:MAG: hypothetical protein IK004_00500 [Bacteroidales bacterium]|nr:hypothetical protein [Bacteroidales bacterium]